jgi:hypothetical protein
VGALELPAWAQGHGELNVVGYGPLQERINARREMLIELGDEDIFEPTVIPYNWNGVIRGLGGKFNTRFRAPLYVAQNECTLEGFTMIGAPLYWVSGYLGKLSDVQVFGPGSSLNIGLLPQGGRPAPYPGSWPSSLYPSALQLTNVYVGGDCDHVRILASDVHWAGGSCERVREGLWWSTYGDFGVGSCERVRFESDAVMPLELWGAQDVRFANNFYYNTALRVRSNSSPASGFGDAPALYGESTLHDERAP